MKKTLTLAFTFCALFMFSACNESEGNKDSLTGGRNQDREPFTGIGEETGSDARMPGNDSTYITTDSVIPAGGERKDGQPRQ